VDEGDGFGGFGVVNGFAPINCQYSVLFKALELGLLESQFAAKAADALLHRAREHIAPTRYLQRRDKSKLRISRSTLGPESFLLLFESFLVSKQRKLGLTALFVALVARCHRALGGAHAGRGNCTRTQVHDILVARHPGQAVLRLFSCVVRVDSHLRVATKGI
jgi:hypothetical protein